MPGESHVEGAFPDPLHQSPVAIDAGRHVQGRVLATEGPQHGGEQRFTEVLLHSEPDLPLQQFPFEGEHGFVIERQQPLGVAQQALTAGRRHQVTSLLHDQIGAALLFEFFQLGADRRGGAAQPLRRQRKAAALQPQHVAAQGIEIQAGGKG